MPCHPPAAGPALIALCAVLLPMASATAGEIAWTDAGEVNGVPMEWRPSLLGHRAYRGTTVVCTSLETLRDFVIDASRLGEWIPFTEAAHAVPAPDGEHRYYLRTSAPWPLKSRDMVYALSADAPAGARSADDALRLDVRGLPDAVPEHDAVVRMRAAEGGWILAPEHGAITVSFELAVDPGRVPDFFVNRRLAATVGGTLANLTERFPCDGET
jgi:hypothetical protein